MFELTELQRIVFPDLEICQELRLYAFGVRDAEYAYRPRELRIREGGRVSLGTLYGAFSLGKWRSHTGISRLRLRMDLCGVGQIELWNWRSGHPRRLLAVEDVDTETSAMVEVPFREDADGIIVPELVAWQPTTVRGGAWSTPDEPRRAVALGIVITTFRREAAVKATVRRLLSGLLCDAWLDASIIVVDNGGTLAAEDVDGARLISSPNLGGSGGFARGLVHLQDCGRFTHAVFIDDDATAEFESIRRAVQFLRYAKDEKAAIVSALISEESPGIQIEVGGQMSRDMWGAVRKGADLRKTRSLVENELPLRIDYGGWWMFFFPLPHVRYLPFPFFLRGDDVEFSQANDFGLVTLNGIASFGASFQRKESPLTTALDRRGMLVNVLLHKSLKTAVTAVIRGLTMAVQLAGRYCYDHVDAMALGLRDVLAGPGGFEDAGSFPDGCGSEIAACVHQRRVAFSEVGADYAEIEARRRGLLWHALRWVSCNGHLLPRFLLIRPAGILDTIWSNTASDVFLRPMVLIRGDGQEQAIIARRDSVRYFSSLARMALVSARLLVALPRLRTQFRAARTRFGSRDYWDRQFQVHDRRRATANPGREAERSDVEKV